MHIGWIETEINHSFPNSIIANHQFMLLRLNQSPCFCDSCAKEPNSIYFFLTVIVSITKKNINVLVLHSCLLSFSLQTHISWYFSASLSLSFYHMLLVSLSLSRSYSLPISHYLCLSHSLSPSPSISPSLSPCHTGRSSPPPLSSPSPSPANVNIVSTLPPQPPAAPPQRCHMQNLSYSFEGGGGGEQCMLGRFLGSRRETELSRSAARAGCTRHPTAEPSR